MRRFATVVCGATALLSLAAPSGIAHADALLVNGAGSTFGFPMYSKWFSDYAKINPSMHFNYQSIGSGGGIKQITERTVDFGASDAPMTDAELAKAPGILHIPTVIGAVVIACNLPGVSSIQLAPDVVADIFLGKIVKWNDPRIQSSNNGVNLPDVSITVAHRSDGSGTTAVFTDYLGKVSPAWKTSVGVGKSVKWPVGLGGKGNEGVTGTVKSTPGAVGYVELAYARQNKMLVAAIRNHDGKFIAPTIESASAAAAGVTPPPDFRVSITDAPGATAYPISAFTYLLVYADQTDATKGAALVNFLAWSIHDGQKLAAPLDYAPLPAPIVKRIDETLRTIKSQGKAILK